MKSDMQSRALPDRRALYASLLALMLPVVLQNLLSAVVNSADIFMLASVSQAALSASSLAGQMTFIFNVFPWSISAGATLMAAQYFGKGDVAVIRRVQGLGLDLMLAASLAFCAVGLLAPRWVMGLLTDDPALIALGADFLRVLVLSYVPMGASQVLLAIFKSRGQTRLSALITTICLLCNITGNFISIKLLFPHDARLAMIGVAVSTLLSRLLELALCLAAIRRGNGVPLALSDCLRLPRWIVRDYVGYTLPMMINNMIASFALATLTAIMGHLSSDMVSANAIASNVRELSTVVCMALGTAGGILMGQEMGAGRLERAKALSHTLERLALLLGALAGLLLVAIRPLIVELSDLTGSAAQLLHMMIPICAAYCIGRSYNATMFTGMFCAGGDTRFGVVLDTITMWVIVVPMSYLAAFVFKWPPMIIYLLLNLDEFVKMLPCAIRMRRYKWLRNLTR